MQNIKKVWVKKATKLLPESNPHKEKRESLTKYSTSDFSRVCFTDEY